MSRAVVFFVCAVTITAPSFGVGGDVDIKAHPYHVSVERLGKHVCSGAFIHESWILTAASCIFGVAKPSITVRVRTSSVHDGDELSVDDVVVHEHFDKYVYHNNIALLKLTTPAEFGEKLLPIGLPDGNESITKDGTVCYVTGWEPTNDPAASRLKVTTVPIVNQGTCAGKMPGYEPLTERMICAGNMTQGVDTCPRDPGAPLTTDQTLIGILSYGLGCETNMQPGVYTRVESYLSWISSNSGVYFF